MKSFVRPEFYIFAYCRADQYPLIHFFKYNISAGTRLVIYLKNYEYIITPLNVKFTATRHYYYYEVDNFRS